MKKPIIIWVIILGLFLNGAYQLYAFSNFRNPFLLAILLFSFAAAVGLFLTKKWSVYVIIFLSIVSGALWLGGIREIYNQGWPYTKISDTITSLIPGTFYLLWWLSISCYVSYYFAVKLKR